MAYFKICPHFKENSTKKTQWSPGMNEYNDGHAVSLQKREKKCMYIERYNQERGPAFTF